MASTDTAVSDKEKPNWNTQVSHLKGHLIKVEPWLFNHDSRFATYLEHGYVNSRNKTLVSDIAMIPDIKARTQMAHSFEDPFPVSNPSVDMRATLAAYSRPCP